MWHKWLTLHQNCMSVLGNRLTLLSPSRGMSAELGSSITVLLASQYGIPVSTTMCIVGSTSGVGLISGGREWLCHSPGCRLTPCSPSGQLASYRLDLYRMGPHCPCECNVHHQDVEADRPQIAGIAAGCLLGIILNSPHW